MASPFFLYRRREAGVLSDTAYWRGTRDSVNLIKRLKKTKILEGHSGCVNTIAWNNSGTRLISGSDDLHLKMYDPYLGLEVLSARTMHRSNIFSARFLSSCEGEGVRVVSCAGVGTVEYSEISPMGCCLSHPFQCNRSITYQVATTPGDGNEFMTCEEKGYVRLYDLRVKSECLCDGCDKDVLYSFPAAVSCMAVHPISPYYLAFGLGNGSVQVLDRRKVDNTRKPSLHSPIPPSPSQGSTHRNHTHRKYTIDDHAHKITSVQFNQDGSQILASYSEDYVYLFNSALYGCGGERAGTGIVKPIHLSQCEAYYPAAVPRKRKTRVGSATGERASRGNSSQTQSNQTDTASPSNDGKERPVMKKLRLRGDWSDTGPEARPEPEGAESRGQNLMNHMSRMFSQWIDMSLSSDDQERRERGEGEGEERGAGGPLGPGLARARRRISERRRLREEQSRLERERDARGSEERESSSSSDTSFVLFDDAKDASGDSCEMSTANSSSVGLPQCENAEGSKKEDNEYCREGKTPELCPRSSGECTENVPTEDAMATRGKSRSPVLEPASQDGTAILESQTLCPKPPAISNSSNGSQSCGSEGKGSTMVVENRSLSYSAGQVPRINIIEDETDSDDAERDRDTTDTAERHRDITDKVSDSTDSDSGQGDHGTDPGGSGPGGVKGYFDDEVLEQCLKETEHFENIRPFRVYKGHRNSRTMIKQANFFGESFVLSGSDCGRVFVWDKWSGKIVNMLLADSHVVNCIQPHPQAYLIATSGIDYNIKLWEPVDTSTCTLEDLEKVVERNSIMLEESRNTVTMPSMIFLQVLSYLNRRRRMRGEEEDSAED